MRLGLATLHHGRPGHLQRQAAAVRALAGLDRYLVVAMDDHPVPPGAERLALPVADPDRLPLSAARNAAIRALADMDLVVLLDVDVIPDPGLLTALRAAAAASDPDRSLLLGPVGWLTRPVPDSGPSARTRADARRTVIRDFPSDGIAPEPRPELFWSLLCAMSPAAHRASGGFDERYLGWGAEDTDFGRRAVGAGLGLWKVADAWGYHQPHPPSRRTPGQVAALAANAQRFHDRWGDWPMPDVLAELTAAGQIAWAPDAATIDLLAASAVA